MCLGWCYKSVYSIQHFVIYYLIRIYCFLLYKYSYPSSNVQCILSLVREYSPPPLQKLTSVNKQMKRHSLFKTTVSIV